MAASFEPLSERTIDFGRTAYIEIARKRLRKGDASSEFIMISRGFYSEERNAKTGEKEHVKRCTKFVTLPDDDKVKAFIAKALMEV